MARVEITDVVAVVDGGVLRAVSGASVLVRTVPGGATATIYVAETGSQTRPNPLTTSLGRIEGWVEEALYDLVVTPPTAAPGEALFASYVQRFGRPPGSGGGVGGIEDVPGLQAALEARATDAELQAARDVLEAALARTGNPPEISRVRPSQPAFPGQRWIELGDDGQPTGQEEVAP